MPICVRLSLTGKTQTSFVAWMPPNNRPTAINPACDSQNTTAPE